MTTGILKSVKRPVLVGVGSGACSVAIVLAWLKFPLVVPWPVLLLAGAASAASVVAGAVVVVRVVRMLVPTGPLAVELPRRSLVALGALFALCNGALLWITNLRPSPLHLLVFNTAIPAAWLGARRAAARRVGRGTVSGSGTGPGAGGSVP